MLAAALVAADPAWRRTYRRLAIGLAISLITLTLSNAEIWQGFYRSASLGDVMWILPFVFYPWAASDAPPSVIAVTGVEEASSTASGAWVIVGGLGAVSVIGLGVRR